jgi:protein TonB
MFESSLIDLEAKKHPRRRRWTLFPLAIALHLVALVSFTFAGYWQVSEVPEPPTSDVLFVTMEPPPPPPPAGGGRTPTPTVKPTVKPPTPPTPEQTVQPDDTPEDLPDPVPGDQVADMETSGGHPDGVDGGQEGGQKDGVIGSTGTGPIGSIGIGTTTVLPAPAEDQPIRVFGAVKRPEMLSGAQPRYTEPARRARIQGTVILEAVIDQKGRVTDLRVLKGLPLGLDQSALDAVRDWRFKPATLEGRPVRVFYTLTVNFQIQS